MVVLRNVSHDHFRGLIPPSFPLDVGVEAEGTVVGAASLALDPDGFGYIRSVLGEDGRQIGQVNSQRIQERWGSLLALGDATTLADDVPVIRKRVDVQHRQV